MAKKDKSEGGFQSAAGLIRYFDAEEESAIHIDPRIVLAMGVIFGVIIAMLSWRYGF
ncbi:MAG: preprotein translocase subunit Sec61beta [Candidatus Thermoplasmatota archaeon]|jgi:preprotein translocase subunit Sec61beta|nr:preprotein translocase subunit Sec61beta [Candidatus Thermoplasmatota archaeon]MCL5962961.1 preprotein translocase subunit Sec61beta [Candidatus Thermoplasmatota archaeon]